MIESNPSGHEDHLGSYPRRETYVDCGGEVREFYIQLDQSQAGYWLRATESNKGFDGYQFAAHHPVAAHLALAELRKRISTGIATRYLVTENGRDYPGHDRLAGTISSGGVVVDGRFISAECFWEMLQTYEGHQFSLRLADPFDSLE